MNKLLTFLVIFLSLTLVFCFAGVKDQLEKPVLKVSMERSPGTFDRAEYVRTQQEKYDWLISESVALRPDSVISISVSPAELEEMKESGCVDCGKSKKLRVGIAKSVNMVVDFGRLSRSGRLMQTSSGGLVWTGAAESKGATALRVHITDFNLPENAGLYIYNMDGLAFGPYTGMGPNGTGEFFTNTVSGEVAYLQVHWEGDVRSSDLRSTRFSISGVGHMGETFLLPFMRKDKINDQMASLEALCSYNAPCVEDASCYNSTPVIEARDAVAHMLFVSGGWYYICSGGLIADSDPGTQIPYFLTAAHCISRSSEAAGLECYFQYATNNCGGNCYDPIGAVPRTIGSEIVTFSKKNGDFCLLRLSQAPPSGSVFLGWDNTPVAFINGFSLYRISHPQGAPQAYSQHNVDSNTGTCRSWPRGKWIYSTDIVGATEGGSSGSPVVNSSGRVVGQLSGSCGYNTGDVCDAESNSTVDGAFASYYSMVEPYLGGGVTPPGGTETHVDAITLSSKAKGPRLEGIATVTVKDENGNPVEGATVSGTFSGDFSLSTSAITNADGEAVLKTGAVNGASNFSFCVDNITHTSMTYNPGANLITCGSF